MKEFPSQYKGPLISSQKRIKSIPTSGLTTCCDTLRPFRSLWWIFAWMMHALRHMAADFTTHTNSTRKRQTWICLQLVIQSNKLSQHNYSHCQIRLTIIAHLSMVSRVLSGSQPAWSIHDLAMLLYNHFSDWSPLMTSVGGKLKEKLMTLDKEKD